MQPIDLFKSLNDFLRHLSLQGKSPNTLKNYRLDLNSFMDYYFLLKKNHQLTQFEASEAKAYFVYLEKRLNSSNSLRRGIQSLRIFFDYLIANYHFPQNPFKSLPVAPKVLAPPDPVPFHHILDLVKLIENDLNSQNGHSYLLSMRNLVLVHLIYHAGLKVSDLESLKKEDLFLDTKAGRVLVSPKEKDPYSIPLPDSSIKLLKDYVELYVESDYVFFNANAYRIQAQGISSRGIELVFSEFRRRLKKKITARQLRQSCIMHWLVIGKPDSLIKEWLDLSPQYSFEPYKLYLQEHPSQSFYQELIYES